MLTRIKKHDILIVATGPNTLLSTNHFPNGKETLVIDLSIPHNVEKNVTENENVTLIDVDELSKQIQETIQQREKEIPKAEKIIKELMKRLH
jgi:glutamyl-tRNA reductase